MRIVKIVTVASILVMMLSAPPGINLAEADEMTKSANGIKATFKINASKNMVDLYLLDQGASRPIADSKAVASITDPDGRKGKKELMGMKMGDAVSYMSTLDMSKKGRYIFDITAESGKKKARFHFTYEVK